MTMPTGELDQAVAQAQVGITEAPAAVQGRSLWALAWRRIRRSKVAMASLGFIVFLILLAIFAPLIVKINGNDPYTFHNSTSVGGDTPGDPSQAVDPVARG
jgi:ABC-type dipeptide/oligopeptide/nickel transport system permease subunit